MLVAQKGQVSARVWRQKDAPPFTRSLYHGDEAPEEALLFPELNFASQHAVAFLPHEGVEDLGAGRYVGAGRAEYPVALPERPRDAAYPQARCLRPFAGASGAGPCSETHARLAACL